MFDRTIASWRRHGLGFWETLNGLRRGFRRNHLDAFSAQYAYYGLLVIPPALILLIRAASELPWEGLLETLIQGANDSLPAQARDIIVAQIQDMRSDRSDSLLYMALAVFTVAGLRLVRTVGSGLNAAYGVQESRPWWQRWTLTFLLVITAFLAILTALALMVAGADVESFLVGHLDLPALSGALGHALRWTTAVGLVLLSASTIYWIVPNVRASWVLLSPGSLFAAAGWIGLSTGFRIYKDNFNRFNETYGALGGVIVLLAWLYLSGAALFLGGQLQALLYRAAEREREAEEAAASLDGEGAG